MLEKTTKTLKKNGLGGVTLPIPKKWLYKIGAKAEPREELKLTLGRKKITIEVCDE